MTLRCQVHRLMPRAAIERFQEWVYHTDHPIEALIAAHYFRGLHDRLLKGDVIEAYAVGVTRARHARLLVSRSDRDAVTVAPFAPAHEIGAFHIDEAPLSAAPGGAAATEKARLEFEHLRHGAYRIVDGAGDVVVGDIRGHAYGIDLYGRLRHGKITVEGARREVERNNLDALARAERSEQRSA